MSDDTNPAMSLGAFSVSLPVADLAASRAFYGTLADPDGHRIMVDQFWPRPDTE